MMYWLLFKRSFRSFPAFFMVNFIAAATAVLPLFLVRYILHPSAACSTIDKTIVFVLAFLSLSIMLFCWGLLVAPLRTVACRKSTLMIPGFRRINGNFYVFFGLCVFLLLSSAVSLSIGMTAGEPARLVLMSLGYGVFTYGLLLFLAHFLGVFVFLLACFSSTFISYLTSWVGFQGVHMLVGMFRGQIAVLFFLLGCALIVLYREAIIRLTEESVLFKHKTRAVSFRGALNIEEIMRQRAAFFSRKGFWTDGYRFTLDFFLNLSNKLNIPRSAQTSGLPILKNNIDLLSFSSIAGMIVYMTVLFAILGCAGRPAGPHGWWYSVIPLFVLTGRLSSMNGGLKQDAVKPVSRKRLFIATHAGIYLSAMVITVVFHWGGELGMWIVRRETPMSPLLPHIIGVLLVLSFLLIVKRFIKHLMIFPFVFCVAMMLPAVFPTVPSSLKRMYSPDLLLPLALALTVIFSIIAFRLDLKQDIA